MTENYLIKKKISMPGMPAGNSCCQWDPRGAIYRNGSKNCNGIKFTIPGIPVNKHQISMKSRLAWKCSIATNLIPILDLVTNNESSKSSV